MAKRKSPLKEMIDKSLSDLQNSGFEPDETLEEREISGPERFAKGQKAKDEVIIDSQLADIAGREGYFLKLKKELRPGLGEWMLMKTIENEWRQWADTETEVAKIVKEHTKVSPAKWGTGPYRIEYASKMGVRGKTYPPRDFYINAEEEFLNPHTVGANAAQVQSDPTTQVTAQLDMLGRLLDVTRGFQPAPLDPAKIQEQQAAAFEKGLSIKAGEGSNNNAMMTAMITGMMGMMTAVMTGKKEEPKVVNPTEGLTGMLSVMKDFGVLGNQQPTEKPKSTIEFLTELKALGMDVFKKDDPLDQISKLKQIASIASDFMGMGGTAEKPSILEKCVDMLGPAIPAMVKQISEASSNAVQAQVEAGKNIERTKIAAPVVHPNNEGQHMQGTQMNTASNTAPQANPQIVAFFNGLHEAVKTNNRLYYPIVYASLLGDPKGAELIQGIISGTQTAKELVDLLQSYGDTRFKDSEFVMKHLVSYVNGYIIWLRDMTKPKSYAEATQEVPATNGFVAPKGPGYDIECQTCHTVFVYENAEEFAEEEEKICGQNGCVGVLKPLIKAS
jgi:hypothetical protein